MRSVVKKDGQEKCHQCLDRQEQDEIKQSLCTVLHLGWNSLCPVRPAAAWLGKSLSERELGVRAGSRTSTSQQCATAAKGGKQILGCVHRGITSSNGDAIPPLYSALVRLYLE